MEMMMEYEQEETVDEIQNGDETREELPQLQDSFTSRQINTQEPEEITEVAQEEVVVNTLTINQQINLTTIINEEKKQYIFMEEMRDITQLSMSQRNTKILEKIKLMRQKIRNQKDIIYQEEIETNNEISKLSEVKNFTQYTKDYLDVLKTYIESMEQQVTKLKFADLEKKLYRIYEKISQMVNKKLTTISEMKTGLKNMKSVDKETEHRYGDELNVMLDTLKNEKVRLKNDVDIISQQIQELGSEISKIDQELEEQNEKVMNSTEIKTIMDMTMKHIVDFKSISSNLQELETKRNSLMTSSELSTNQIKILEKDLEEGIQNNKSLELELEQLEADNNDLFEQEDYFEGMEISELEQEKLKIEEEYEEIGKLINSLKKEEMDRVVLIHEKEVLLLKTDQENNSLRQQQAECQNSNENANIEVEKLETETEERNVEIQRKQDELKRVEQESKSLEDTKTELETSLVNHQKELSRKDERLNYERNTLLVHQKKKLEDLEEKLSMIEKKNEEGKKEFADVEAVNKKKTDAHKRLRNLYMMLKSPRKPALKEHADVSEIREDAKENIEAENTSTEVSPKSILKSPTSRKTSPTTPTKNVKFVGVPSMTSSNSSEMVNVESQEKEDVFNQLKKNLVQRDRTFD